MTTISPNVLVIDDDRDTLKLLSMALERNGYNVITAASWEETATQVESTYRLNKPVDVILLDLMMPDRSGFDIFRSLQVVLVPMPPVIVLTAVTGFEQQLEARRLGVIKYMTKPTTPEKLMVAIKQSLTD